MKRSLLLGCGHSREKKVRREDQPDWIGELTTVDMSPDVGADMVFDIARIPFAMGVQTLPFESEAFDEIGAYDCLEHWGKQGDWYGWFAEMGEYHRILKPGGTMGILVPVGSDALADPGHTRFFSKSYFSFLDQRFYDLALAQKVPITDYRWVWKKNFKVIHMEQSEHHLSVMLEKV